MNKFDFYELNKNIQIAHRGFSQDFPENTMIAFQKALEKTKIIELDVTFSSDGIAIVIHDDTLNRTSNVEEVFPKKKNLRVDEYTFDELRELDFSSWFTKQNEIYDLQKIPTLEEVLLFCNKNKAFVNIEIKDLKDTVFHKTCVEEVVKLVKKHNMKDKVIISSFVSEYIAELNNHSICKAFLDEKLDDIYLLEFLLKNNIQAYHCSDEIVNEELVQELLDHDIYTCVFTVNNEKRKKELFSWGVKAVFTDCPS